ncbi:TldD/PmbA family protein [Candidatus Fermentibacteria bacterium]|nr:TldD/PmbA family protein [Candidatus Fermentibacteria bacterium]
MKALHLAHHGLDALRMAGAHKATCSVSHGEQHELTANVGKISLMRTTYETAVGMSAIIDGRRGAASANKTSQSDLERLARETVDITQASPPDPAYDIAERQEPATFERGPHSPNRDLMFSRFQEFLDTSRRRYPSAIVEEAVLEFSHGTSHIVNTNGVEFSITAGLYGFQAMFTAKDGTRTSSFNGASFSSLDLDRPLIEVASVDRLLRESCEQLDPLPIPDAFVGDLILTPDTLAGFIRYFAGVFLRDGAIIAGTSRLKDKINQPVAAPCLTVRDLPLAPELAVNHFVTADGFLAKDQTIIDRGVLRTFLLSLYGSRKTGCPRSVSDGTSYVVDAGDIEYRDLLGSVERGIVLGRFSGGSPGESGDLSGVAKNSYYVEHGEVRHPVTETMVSSNLIDLFENIAAVSAERIDFGSTILPWVRCRGVTISGK